MQQFCTSIVPHCVAILNHAAPTSPRRDTSATFLLVLINVLPFTADHHRSDKVWAECSRFVFLVQL